jgi:hypothetical protein
MSLSAIGGPTIYTPARRWTRYKLDVPVRVIVHNPSKSRIINGRGKEISEGGMSVFAGIELQAGERIEVEFTPPYGLPIRVHGLVRNRSGYSYGVEFLAASPEEMEEVAALRSILRSSTGLS